MRTSHLVVWVDHNHFSDLSLHELVEQLVSNVDCVLFKLVSDIYGLLDGRVSGLADYSIHDTFVDLMRQDNGGQDVNYELVDDPIHDGCDTESNSWLVRKAGTKVSPFVHLGILCWLKGLLR